MATLPLSFAPDSPITFTPVPEIVQVMTPETSTTGRGELALRLLGHDGSLFVQQAYLAILGRPADPDGTTHYLSRLNAGTSKRQVLRELADSAEAAQRHPDRGRLLDVLGIGEEDGEDDGASVLDLELIRMFELDDDAFVQAAYRRLLHRQPDRSGQRFYVASLVAGSTKLDVLAQLYASEERRKSGNRWPALERGLRARTLRRIPGLRYLLDRSPSIARFDDTKARLRQIERDIDELRAKMTQGLDATRQLAQSLSARAAEARSSGSYFPEPVVRPAGTAATPSVTDPPEEMARLRRPARERKIYFYVDHTVQCPVNTGMQRVVRRLGRALLDAGESVIFVKWDVASQSLVRVSRSELAYLGQWHGPAPNAERLESYADGEAVPLAFGQRGSVGDDWLIVPEVTHITYHANPVTLDLILAARRAGLRISFIYYDAVPLRLASYRDTAERHEAYMQHLLLADHVAPISHRSAEELAAFLRVHQRNQSDQPVIEAMPLPAESQLTPRVTRIDTASGETLILSVGSIEPRKNQLSLIEAFQRHCDEHPDTPWQLTLAGHLRADVAASVMESMAKNPRITHVQSISDPDLDMLYRRAAFTVFPSVEEGFGLPILESLWYGKPCICADFGAMGEVGAGGGCLKVDTRSVAALHEALERLISDSQLRRRLSLEAVSRHLPTWAEYSARYAESLAREAASVPDIGTLYYWVTDTSVNPSNSGIQRVTRQLAKGLAGIGTRIVPVIWDAAEERLDPATPRDLEHLSQFDGPPPSVWTASALPAIGDPGPNWLLVPELTHANLDVVVRHARSRGLRPAAIFYDTIPYKLRPSYGAEFAANHARYLEQLLQFDKIFPISRYSSEELFSFYLQSTAHSTALAMRVTPVLLPDEFAGALRSAPLPTPSDHIQILAVVSIEPRKNPIRLLEAFELASRKAKHRLDLTIVGRKVPAFAALADDVEARIAGLGRATWETDVSDERLATLMTLSDFTVFPSVEEGFGLPILESLWSGRPCICDDGGAMAEVAVGGGCLMVDMHDANAIAKAIVTLADDPNLRSRLAAEAAARPARTWSDYATEIAARLAEASFTAPRHMPAIVAEEESLYRQLPNLSRRPTLSVCISTYNRGPWLAVALRNLARLLPEARPDVEIVVCDNCSTDATPDVVQPYLGRSDFRSYRNPVNVGMLGNLRVTAQHARGRYVWILGDDDLPFTNSIDRILTALEQHPEAALVYLNYSYTRETDPSSVKDLEAFLASGTPVAPSGPDRVAPIRDLAVMNENLFTAIYCLIFRRDHALRAYSQDTTGRPFSTMRTSIPTTYHVLHSMMNEVGIWIGDPQVIVNFNVSWNDYAALQILERVPEALDEAEWRGSPVEGIDRWRSNLLPGYVHYFKDIYGPDPKGNSHHFSAARVVARAKHLPGFSQISAELEAVYRDAHVAGHPAARETPETIFGSREP